MGKSVLLLVNRDKPEVAAALPSVRSLIERHGRIVAEAEAGGDRPIDGASGADLIVVLGGDGTLLSQSRRCVRLGLPLLGVNFGKLGFLAEFDLAALRDQAGSLFGDGELVTQDRPMIRATVRPAGAGSADADGPGGGDHFNELALNDCVVTAGPPFRMIALSLLIDGEPGPTVSGDGLIVSTPIGSTAYNVSAGGPIISPDVDAMVITPIAAHSLSFRPVVVRGGSRVELGLERVNDDGGGGGTTLVLDGQVHTRLSRGDRVLIRRHDLAVRFVKNPRGTYWSTLIGKMHWAAAPRAR